MMRKTAAALAICATSAPAFACDQLVFHGLSAHTPYYKAGEYNSAHPGIGCRLNDVDGSGFDIQAGVVFKNSYNNQTVYILADRVNDFGLGVFAGFATGYTDLETVFTAIDDRRYRYNPSRSGIFGSDIVVIGGAVWHQEYFTIRVSPIRHRIDQQTDWGAVATISFHTGKNTASNSDASGQSDGQTFLNF